MNEVEVEAPLCNVTDEIYSRIKLWDGIFTFRLQRNWTDKNWRSVNIWLLFSLIYKEEFAI